MKIVKTNDCITKSELIKRGWAEEKIDMFLCSNKVKIFSDVYGKWNNAIYSKSKAIETENYLTKMGIEWRVKE